MHFIKDLIIGVILPCRGKDVAGQGSSLDKKRGLCVQVVGGGDKGGQGERERVGGNEAGFVQRALNAMVRDLNLVL